MRTKKIALNMFFDIMPYLLIGVVGLIKVNYLIKYIGDVGNGYYQFITQLISYVFLAQAGFSEAVTYSLYKPFAEKNKNDVGSVNMIPEAILAGREKMPVDKAAAAKGDSISAEEQPPAELILTLKNKKQIPFSKLAKAKRGGKGTLKKI